MKTYGSSAVQPVDWQDLNRDGRVSFGELVLSTFFVMGLVFGGLLILAVAVGGLVGSPFWDIVGFVLRWWVWIALVVSTLAGVGLGVWRSLRYEREEGNRTRELQRRWRFEDEDREHLNAVVDAETRSRFTQADVDAGARLYLHRYYSGRGLSRSDWVKDGLSKDLWDHVNSLAKERGIRKGRRAELTPSTFAEAWAVWCDAKLKARSWLVSDGDLLEKR